MSPITRIAPRRPEAKPKAENNGSLSQLSPGRYQATIKDVEEVQGVYKSGRNVGKNYTAVRVHLSLTTPQGEFTLPATLFDKSKQQRSLFDVWAEDETVNDPKDMVGKKVGVYLDRNDRGYLNAVEFFRGEK
jgi:hypothetical protein